MNDDIPWPRPGQPLSPASLLAEIDDVVYDLLEHEEGWTVRDVIASVERRIDVMVLHKTSLRPDPEVSSRMLAPEYVHGRIRAVVKDIESRVVGRGVSEHGEPLVYVRRRSPYMGNELDARITGVSMPDEGEPVVTMGIGF
ncbi:hypothetical protein FHR70_002522 [Microvirga lupini]|uniref:Uncharacterized protein n=1 Tax=Microvirga lupini TaxID=420324 RepID=A0A7W4VML6_9HYPH|nr:hypothetical protein [Microvirga lupini]MBB3019457.1 hypothetical protein [Microvirga lupini]